MKVIIINGSAKRIISAAAILSIVGFVSSLSTHPLEHWQTPHPLHGAMLSLSGSMISISFFSDAPFTKASIAVRVFPFLALPFIMI